MAPPQSSVEYYAEQRAILIAALAASRRIWGETPPADFDSWFAKVVDMLVALVSAAQRRAVAGAETYVEAALAELDADIPPDALPTPGALTGIASDGRPLDGTLYSPIITAKGKLAQDVPPRQAWAAGRDALQMRVQTQVADAARVATSLSITARRGVGYTRMLVPPSCSRCAILAGRFYRYSSGFLRHPSCDCRHIPAVEGVADDLTTDPSEYFDSLDAAQQDRIFTKSGARAIREGADINRVVNMRGVNAAGAKRYRGGRLMPEAIYRQAGSREQALNLLRANGYMQ